LVNRVALSAPGDAEKILNHPEVYPWVTWEGYKGNVHSSVDVELTGYSGDEAIAIWRFHALCPGVWTVHVASLPGTQGMAKAFEEVKRRIKWKGEGARKLIAFIPADNVKAIKYAEKLGFECEGLSNGVWPRNGEFHDIIYYGLKLCH